MTMVRPMVRLLDLVSGYILVPRIPLVLGTRHVVSRILLASPGGSSCRSMYTYILNSQQTASDDGGRSKAYASVEDPLV
jgi:hypothetical protein